MKPIRSILLIMLLPIVLYAAPSGISVSGTVGEDESITITGVGFGTKSTAAPIKFDDFDDGEIGGAISNGWTITSEDGLFGSPKYNNTSGRTGSTAHSRHSFDTIDHTIKFYTSLSSETTIYVTFWRRSIKGSGTFASDKAFRITGDCIDESKNALCHVTLTETTWGTNLRNYLEQYIQIDGQTTYEVTYPTDNVWQRFEGYYVLDSPAGTANGTIQEWWQYGGEGNTFSNPVNFSGNQQMRSEDEDSYCWDCIKFGEYANPSDSLTVDWDDVYIDNTQARVEIGDNATWANCTHREIQIPTAWSDTSITVTVNQGSFSAGNTVYLFVVDSDGATGVSGALTIGSGSSPAVSGNGVGGSGVSNNGGG